MSGIRVGVYEPNKTQRVEGLYQAKRHIWGMKWRWVTAKIRSLPSLPRQAYNMQLRNTSYSRLYQGGGAIID